uniref:Uncharacterized protein n=1 Tax=Arundo donax TaxID=35708 RepID=A0A0A9FBU3_ARUDO
MLDILSKTVVLLLWILSLLIDFLECWTYAISNLGRHLSLNRMFVACTLAKSWSMLFLHIQLVFLMPH